MEKELCVKEVMFNGSPLRACQDENGMVYVGLRWICDGLGLSQDRMKYERKKVQEDIVLYRGVKFYPIGNDRAKSDVLCLQIDYVPIWLAKISITPKMEKENPLLVERIVEYQLRCKDVLAREFVGGENNSLDEFALINQKLDRLYDNMSKLANLIISMKENRSTIAVSVKNEITEKTPYELWKAGIYDRINEFVKESRKYSCPGGVLRALTRYMRTNYGIVWEQEAKEYMAKYDSKPRKLNLIYEKENLRSIFESILNDLICNRERDEADTYNIDEVICPLVEKLNDTSLNGCNTYKRVFDHMSNYHDVDWKKESKKYVNQSGSHKVSKKIITTKDQGLKEIFQKSVSEMMK